MRMKITHVDEAVLLRFFSMSQHCFKKKNRLRKLINQTSISKGTRRAINGRVTVGCVYVNGRNVGRNEHEKESADPVSEGENDQRPPERHFLFRDSSIKRAWRRQRRRRMNLSASPSNRMGFNILSFESLFCFVSSPLEL